MWEREFAARNDGQKAGREDIKQNSHIGMSLYSSSTMDYLTIPRSSKVQRLQSYPRYSRRQNPRETSPKTKAQGVRNHRAPPLETKIPFQYTRDARQTTSSRRVPNTLTDTPPPLNSRPLRHPLSEPPPLHPPKAPCHRAHAAKGWQVPWYLRRHAQRRRGLAIEATGRPHRRPRHPRDAAEVEECR